MWFFCVFFFSSISLIFFVLQERHNAKTVGEIKQFVSQLPHMQAARSSLANHTSIAELIKDITSMLITLTDFILFAIFQNYKLKACVFVILVMIFRLNLWLLFQLLRPSLITSQWSRSLWLGSIQTRWFCPYINHRFLIAIKVCFFLTGHDVWMHLSSPESCVSA